MPSGKVLVSGGWGSDGPLASTEVYDPTTEVWSTTGTLSVARHLHTATRLPSGKVLVSGGQDRSSMLASTEVYDPATEWWSTTDAMATVRSGHTATLLPSGKVLVSGGGYYDDSFSNSELYDPATGAWSITGPLATVRHDHTATLLPSGEVLVTGGFGKAPIAKTEVYEDTGVPLEWRPIINPPAEQQREERFSITGSLLRGLSEASSSNAQSSATNLPLVSLLSLEGGTLTRITSLVSVSDTEVSVQTPLVPDGYYILTVMTNAIHGGQLVLVNGPPLTAPKVISPAVSVNTPKPTIRGTAKPGITVVVLLDGAMTGTTTADPQGNWNLTPDTALVEGFHQVAAIAKDAVGNVSPQSKTNDFSFFIQRSHYGWSCTAAPASATTWGLLVLGLVLRRRRLRSP